MGLSVLSFAAALGLAFVILITTRRSRQAQAFGWELGVDLCLLGAAAGEGLLLLLVLKVMQPGLYLGTARFAYFCLALADYLLVGFALSFPRRLGRSARIVPLVLAPLVAWGLALILWSPSYFTKVYFSGLGFELTPGPAFEIVNAAAAGLGVLAAVIHLVRGIQTTDSINRQRSLLAFLGVTLGVTAVWVYQRYQMENQWTGWANIAIPFMSLAMAGIVAYAVSISRLFDWRELFKAIFAYATIAVVIGVPTGAVVMLVAFLAQTSPTVTYAGYALAFLVAGLFARRFKQRFFERVGGRHEYREQLESSLAHVDLSQGRDAVIADLSALLTESLGFTDFTILIEDDRGTLKTAWSSSGGHAGIERADPIRVELENGKSDVLMLSEVQADPAWDRSRDDILGLFSSLKAEALILAREGRRVIGVFAIGARKIGGEYTDYDYDTFKSIRAKLFVFAFYLKNVARESILYTVDRELALSDQVIRFALEHVAPVSHPRADAAWAMRSTRSLGGDFVDFVKIGRERWFFVLGDVSGKGLSASMNMLILKSMVRTFLRIEKDFTGLVQRVNAFIKDHLPRGSFFAGVFGYFDFERNALYFINCGVPAILLYSPAFDAFVEVQGEGKVLGFVRDVRPFLKPRKIALPAGTALVVSTDGLLDSENIRGERFGKERLRKAARDRLGSGAREMADGVLEDLLKFTENRQEDDITLLAMKIR